MSDKNWERVQKERQERIKRLEEESYRKARGAELAQKDEEQNAEFKKAALKHLAEGGKTEDLFYKENDPSKRIKDTAKSIKKEFKGDRSSLLDKIKERLSQ